MRSSRHECLRGQGVHQQKAVYGRMTGAMVAAAGGRFAGALRGTGAR
jgi:hypothetical protein